MSKSKKPKIADLLTVEQYAKLMGVTRQTIYNWIKDEKVKTVSFLGKDLIDKSTYRG